MKLGVAGYGFRSRVGDEESLRLISEAGFDCMDYAVYEHKSSGLFECEISELVTYFEGVKKLSGKYNVAIHQTHAPFGFKDEAFGTDKLLNYNVRSIIATACMGAEYLVIHPVKMRACIYDRYREECFARNIEEYRRLVPYLKEYGVKVALENMFSYDISLGRKLVPTIYSTADELCRAADTLGENFVVCLDTGHARITGENIPEMINKLGDRLKVLHIHDNCGTLDEHSMPYNGVIEWKDLFCALLRSNYGGVFNFEVDLGRVPIDTLPYALTYLRNIGKNLQLQK